MNLRSVCIYATLALGLAGAVQAQMMSGEKLVKPGSMLSVDSVHPGSGFQVAVIAEIEKGWHINANKPTLDFLIPTELTLDPVEGLTFGQIEYPSSKRRKFEFAEEELDVYEDRVIMRFSVAVGRDVSPGLKRVNGSLQYQACNNEVCLAPVGLDVVVPIEVVGLDRPSRPINTDVFGAAGLVAPPDDGGDQGPPRPGSEVGRLIEERGWLLALLSILILGLGLNLTPCVYPMIPITIGYFSNQSEGKTTRVFVLALMYLLGIALTYSTLGVVAALTGQMFGNVLQNSWVLIGIGAVMVLLALSLFGVYQIRPPTFIMKRVSGQSGGGLLGALSMGLVVGIVAAPCVGPVTLGLLTYVGATGNPWLGFVMFFTLSVGLGAPYVALGVFSGGLKRLPRSGMWMIWVERLFGFALIGLALYFVSPLLPDAVVLWVVFALALVSGVYLGFVDRSRTGGQVFDWLKRAVGAAIIGLGIFAVIPKPAAEAIAWRPYEPTLLDQIRTEGRPAILDFYADWCIPCRELDRFTFSHGEVVDATRPFATVKVDLTQYDSPEAERLRKAFNVSGVPTIVFLDAQGKEISSARVVGFLGPKDFLERVRLAQPGP